MENEKETKKRLLECALKEFSEKGYMKASLRNICKEAGVTTGALYFFFKDKDDLFASLVGEPLFGLQELIKLHFEEEYTDKQKAVKGEVKVSQIALMEGFEEDLEISSQIIQYLFQNKDLFLLLLTKAQGSKFENIVDQMVGMVESHYVGMYATMKGYRSKREITSEDRFLIHWMAHDQIEIFIHVFVHCKSIKEAIMQIKNLTTYMIGGWLAVINVK